MWECGLLRNIDHKWLATLVDGMVQMKIKDRDLDDYKESDEEYDSSTNGTADIVSEITITCAHPAWI